LNHESEQVVTARVEPAVLRAPVWTTFQFERLGYFMVDQDSKGDKKVFNRVITLKDRQEPASKGSSRKEQQEQQLAAKLAMKSVKPEEMYLSQTDLYSKWDDQGIPTHDKAGEPLSKNAVKKLKAAWDKQKKVFEGGNKAEPKEEKEQINKTPKEANKERKQSTNEPKEANKERKEFTKEPKEANKERKQSTNEPKEANKDRKPSTNEASKPKATEAKETEATKEPKSEPKQAEKKAEQGKESKPKPDSKPKQEPKPKQAKTK